MGPGRPPAVPHPLVDSTDAEKAKKYMDIHFPAMLLKVIMEDNYNEDGPALQQYVDGISGKMEMTNLQSHITTYCQERALQHNVRTSDGKSRKSNPSVDFFLDRIMKRVGEPMEIVAVGTKRELEVPSVFTSAFVVSDSDLDKCLKDIDSELNVLDDKCKAVCAEIDRRNALAVRIVCEKIIRVLQVSSTASTEMDRLDASDSKTVSEKII